MSSEEPIQLHKELAGKKSALIPIALAKPYELLRAFDSDSQVSTIELYRAAVEFKKAYEMEAVLSNEYVQSSVFWEREFQRMKEEALTLKANEHKGPRSTEEFDGLVSRLGTIQVMTSKFTKQIKDEPIRYWYDSIETMRTFASEIDQWMRLKGYRK